MQYEIPVIPYPKTAALEGGSRPFPLEIAAPDALGEEAARLRGQLARLTGLPVGGAAGGIALAVDESLPDEAYRLHIGQTVALTAAGYTGFCRGLATLLGMGSLEDGMLSLPLGRVEDAPDRPFRGIMLDLARVYHPMPQVLSFLDVCFYLKLNVLHLHFTDDPLYTLPSAAYPKLNTPGASYSREEIAQLTARARDLGVQLLPEIDLPGHAGSLLRAYPQELGTRPFSDRALGMGRESVYQAVDTLIGEVCDLFPDAPMIHIGGDEVVDAGWRACQDCAQYMREHDIPSIEALYSHAVGRIAAMVLARGRRPAVWEGFPPEGASWIPPETLVMPFECAYHQPGELVRRGFQLVSASWKPLYITPDIFWPWTDIYGEWSPGVWRNWVQFSAAYPEPVVVEDTDKILGAQIYSWECSYDQEWSPLIRNAMALSERLWYEDAPFASEEFRARLVRGERALDRLRVR